MLFILSGCSKELNDIEIEFHLVVNDTLSSNSNTFKMSVKNTNEKLLLSSDIALNQYDIEYAQLIKDTSTNSYNLLLTFTAEGVIKYNRLAKNNIGNRLGFIVDEVLICAPVIMDRISSQNVSLLVPGNFTKIEAKDIVSRINN